MGVPKSRNGTIRLKINSNSYHAKNEPFSLSLLKDINSPNIFDLALAIQKNRETE
jgi:hypothetical protein